MIRLTRLNDDEIVLNSDLIEHIQETPDTLILLVTGQAVRVRESMDEVRQRVIEFRRSISHNATAALGPALVDPEVKTYGEALE